MELSPCFGWWNLNLPGNRGRKPLVQLVISWFVKGNLTVFLGKHKGTPMLKNGIKCVGMDPDEETDQSDWGGFN